MGPMAAFAVALLLCSTFLSGTCEGYEVMYGWDVPGRNIYQHRNIGQARCWWKCASNRGGCKVAVYNTLAKLCMLKPVGRDRAVRQPGKSFIRVLYASSAPPAPSPSRSSRNRTPSRSNIAADVNVSSPPPSSGMSYSSNHFVHMPPFFKKGMLDLTCKNLGRGKGIEQCQRDCWNYWGGNACEYVQAEGDGDNCWACKSGGSDDVSDVNAKGRDLNRVNCRNPAYVAAWKSYRGSEDIGPAPCSQISDSKQVLYTVS